MTVHVSARFILDVSVRKQLQKIGSISYTHKPNGEVSRSRGHSPLTLAKPSPSPRSLTPCSPVRSQNRSSSRSPTINSETGSPIPRGEGRRGDRSRSTSASPIPPVMVEETSKLYPHFQFLIACSLQMSTYQCT